METFAEKKKKKKEEEERRKKKKKKKKKEKKVVPDSVEDCSHVDGSGSHSELAVRMLSASTYSICSVSDILLRSAGATDDSAPTDDPAPTSAVSTALPPRAPPAADDAALGRGVAGAAWPGSPALKSLRRASESSAYIPS